MVANRDNNTKELWRQYRSHRTLILRNRLVMIYYDYLVRMATSIAKKCPESVLVDDLVAYGCFGLIKAVEAYDYRPDVPFLGYARRRIKGAILDGMRQSEWGKRTLTEGRHGYHKFPVISLDHEIGRDDNGSGITIGDDIEDGKAVAPELPMQRLDFWRRVTAGMDIKKQQAVFMYFCEGHRQPAISRKLGLTQCRISQLMTEAKRTIKARISPDFIRENIVTG